MNILHTLGRYMFLCNRGCLAHKAAFGVLLLVALSAGASGQELDWAKNAGGAGPDEAYGIAVDGAGSSYVTGYFVGTATFGAGETNETMLISAGDQEVFVAKYDATGALVWAKRAGEAGAEYGSGIAVDGAGNSYVTGTFFGTSTFGPGEANQTILTSSAASADIFVAKYDSNGALVWARRAGGAGSGEEGRGIEIDGIGNSYVVGWFEGTAIFGPGEANQTILTSAGSIEIFLAKYDGNGALLWAKQAGGTGFELGFGIAVDGTGNSYATGIFSGTAIFGPGESNQTILTSSAASVDIFVAKYDSNGALVWAKRAGGTSDDEHGRDITVDGAGNSYVIGLFDGIATFGPGEVNQTTLTSAASVDIFVAKYDSHGTLVWAKRAGGTGYEEGLGIALDGAGNSYVTGLFSNTATFGPGEANQTILGGAGQDAFVAKYDSNGGLLWAERAFGSGSSDRGSDIGVDGAGNSYVIGFFNGSATFGLGEANETILSSAGVTDIFVARYHGSGVSTALVSLSPVQVWIGLKNSDDQGTQFDLRAEFYKNGDLIASGTTLCVTNVTRNPSLAKEVAIPFGPIINGDLVPGDLLSLKVLTRIGTNPEGSKCSGPGGSHNNATGLRLYYDSVARDSQFGIEVTPDPLQNSYLHSVGGNFYFDTSQPTATSAKAKDSASLNFSGGNPWKAIGTWSRTMP